MSTRIVIADDNAFLISAVKEKLSFFKEYEFLYSANNGKDLLDKINQNSEVDFILMDIEMPVMNGIEATNQIKSKYPNIKIVMLTVFDNDENIFKAIKAGADGYLLKEIKAMDLHEGIQNTLNGGAAMNPSIALKTLKLLRNPTGIENSDYTEQIQLSDRETAVLEHLSAGLNYTQIGQNLKISGGTVRKHIENIYKKLQVHNKIEAVTKARENNLI